MHIIVLVLISKVNLLGGVNMYYYPHVENEMNRNYKSLEQALSLVRDAIEGEREDEMFYDYLIAEAPTQEEKQIITTIRNDERKHNKMYRQIYIDFTGQEVMTPSDIRFDRPAFYIEGIKKALFGELSAVEKYRDIRAGMPTRYYRDIVLEILTDELKHAAKYNYILNINR